MPRRRPARAQNQESVTAMGSALARDTMGSTRPTLMTRVKATAMSQQGGMVMIGGHPA